MRRTQMYFDEDDWERMSERARSAGRSTASLVREVVTEYLARSPVDDDPIAALIDWAEANPPPASAPRDSADEHDHYLYGAPKTRTRRRRA